MIRGTVCSNVCMYGSVGALGGQPPRATRQYTSWGKVYFLFSVPTFQMLETVALFPA